MIASLANILKASFEYVQVSFYFVEEGKTEASLNTHHPDKYNFFM